MAFEYTSTAFKTYPAAATAIAVTPVTTAWANSNYFQVVASTANAITLSAIVVDTGVTSEFEIDVATGAAGSEVVIATVSGDVESTAANSVCTIDMPVEISNIASGTRIAVRIRKSATGVVAWGVSLQYLDSATPSGITVTTKPLKCLPSAAAGVSVTPSGTSWGNSAWVQVTASTAAAWILGSVTVNPGQAQPFEVDIGVGASGSEVVRTTMRGNIDSVAGTPFVFPFEPVFDNIASGVRVSVRFRKNATNATAWTFKLNYQEKPL